MVSEATNTNLSKFTPTNTAIAAMAAEYMPLVIRGLDDTDGFKAVHAARMVVKSHRVEVEKVRKALKADALEYGRQVDGEAKRITALLDPIETHLSDEEAAYEAEKEKIRNAARLAQEAEAKARADAEAARVKAEHDAEVERLRSEREKLDAERKAMEAERAAEQAKQKAAQDKIDAERTAIEAEKKRLADIEAARLREIETQRREKEAAERAKIETEQRIAQEAIANDQRNRALEAAKVKAAALRPDREKLLSVAAAVNAIDIPEVSDAADEAAGQVRIVLADAEQRIRFIVETLK